jgi:hypothetical protein
MGDLSFLDLLGQGLAHLTNKIFRGKPSCAMVTFLLIVIPLFMFLFAGLDSDIGLYLFIFTLVVTGAIGIWKVLTRHRSSESSENPILIHQLGIVLHPSVRYSFLSLGTVIICTLSFPILWMSDRSLEDTFSIVAALSIPAILLVLGAVISSLFGIGKVLGLFKSQRSEAGIDWLPIFLHVGAIVWLLCLCSFWLATLFLAGI